MDQNANRSTANDPPPPPAGANRPGDTPAAPPLPPPPAGSGLKSALKIAIPLGVFAAVVFGVTVLTINAPKDDQGAKDQKRATEPLRFRRTNAYWDPPNRADEYYGQTLFAPSVHPLRADNAAAFQLPDRAFQGLYEPGKRYAVFWFEALYPEAISFQLKYASCSACSGGRIAMVPADEYRKLLDGYARAALTPLPAPVLSAALGAGFARELAEFWGRLEWQELSFLNNPNATFKIPPAPPGADPTAPRLGVLVFTFDVGDASKTLEVRFASQVDGTDVVGMHEFKIAYEAVKPLELSQPVIDAGLLEEGSGDRTYTLYAYSATRGPGSADGDLAPPVATPTGDFVQVTKVERVPEGELPAVAREIEAALMRPMRVRSAYRLTVVVRPRVGASRLDIGLLDRPIPLTAGDATQTLRVTARMHGIVRLDKNQSSIDLGTYSGRTPQEFARVLIAEKNTIQLEVVDDECRPRGAYKLERQPDQGGQGYYKLKITPPVGTGNFADGKGMAVLEVKGDRAQRIRIPVTGFAEFK